MVFIGENWRWTWGIGARE